jgi:hypothetical protein
MDFFQLAGKSGERRVNQGGDLIYLMGDFSLAIRLIEQYYEY